VLKTDAATFNRKDVTTLLNEKFKIKHPAFPLKTGSLTNIQHPKSSIQYPVSSITARDAGLVHCLSCHLLIKPGGRNVRVRCPRCGASIEFRKLASIERTWALLITSLIFLFPANLLPIMNVTYLGEKTPNTILDGIEQFIHSGDYFIALIIFFASILVPVFKIAGIMLIMISVQKKWKTWLRHRTLMFRVIKFIGRWSMLDIFVIAILVALVNLGTLTTITPAPAASYFAAVVVFTMLAANTFDARLIWEEPL
jgi:paraquat-inducible protein A